MSTPLIRTSAALFGFSTSLLGGLAAAQPTNDAAPTATAEVQTSTPQADTSNTPEVKPTQAPQSMAPSAAPQNTAPTARSAETSPALEPAPAADSSPPTLFRKGTDLGGYGGLDVAYTRLAGKNAALVCLGGAFLADHRFTLGLVGCGNATRISGEQYGDVVHESGDKLEFGYGGLVIGYQFFPKQVYNLSLTTMVGAGGSAIVNYGDTLPDGSVRDQHHEKTHDSMFVAEPRLTGYVNLTRWARMGVFAGYRFVGGADMKNLSNSDFSGPTVGGTVQFGWF